MKLWDEIRASIHGPEYYKGLLLKPFSYSLSYFASLCACIALVLSIVVFFSLAPAVQSFVTDLGVKVLQYYPADLKVMIQNGVVTTSEKEPYALMMPAELVTKLQEGESSSTVPKNLLVIDTKDPFSIDAYKKADALLYLTNNSVVYTKNGAITIQPLDRVSGVSIDKNTISAFITKAQPYLRFIYPFLALALYAVSFIGLFARIVYIIFFALIVWLIARVRKIGAGYKKSFQMGLHLVTLSMIVNSLLFLLFPSVQIPLLFTALAVIVALVNLREEPPSTAAIITEAPTPAGPQL